MPKVNFSLWCSMHIIYCTWTRICIREENNINQCGQLLESGIKVSILKATHLSVQCFIVFIDYVEISFSKQFIIYLINAIL